MDIAHTYVDGLEFINTNEYILIILDVMLPDGSGYDLCKSIRKKIKTSQ